MVLFVSPCNTRLNWIAAWLRLVVQTSISCRKSFLLNWPKQSSDCGWCASLIKWCLRVLSLTHQEEAGVWTGSQWRGGVEGTSTECSMWMKCVNVLFFNEKKRSLQCFDQWGVAICFPVNSILKLGPSVVSMSVLLPLMTFPLDFGWNGIFWFFPKRCLRKNIANIASSPKISLMQVPSKICLGGSVT